MYLASIREKSKTNGISIEFDDMIRDLGRLTNTLHPLNFQMCSQNHGWWMNFSSSDYLLCMKCETQEDWFSIRWVWNYFLNLPAHNSQLAQEVRTTVRSHPCTRNQHAFPFCWLVLWPLSTNISEHLINQMLHFSMHTICLKFPNR